MRDLSIIGQHVSSRFSVLVLSLILALSYAMANRAQEEQVFMIDADRESLREFGNGKPLLLKFWATWCVECIRQMPDYRALHAAYVDDIQFLAVNVAMSDPLVKVRAAIDQYDLEMPVAYDAAGHLWNDFDVRGTPTYVLMDASGNVVHTGSHHDKSLKQALVNVSSMPKGTIEGILDIDGQPVDLGEVHIGTRVYYHFATWCESYLQETYAELAARCEQFRTDVEKLAQLTDVDIVGFATRYSTTVDSVRNYKKRHRIAHPLIFDEHGVFAQLTGVRDFPYVAVVHNGVLTHASDRIDVRFLTALDTPSQAPQKEFDR